MNAISQFARRSETPFGPRRGNPHQAQGRERSARQFAGGIRAQTSFGEAVAFAEWLNQLEGKECTLPTETEWERAVRAPEDILGLRNQLPWELLAVPRALRTGAYSAEILYGEVGSDVARFRSTIKLLAGRASKIATLDPEEVEYGHQAALFWAEIGKVKEFIGTTPAISEIAAELRTARFQVLGKDTPPIAMKAVATALLLIAEAKRLDEPLVDRFVETLEAGGFDSFAQDALRDSRG